MPYKDKEKQREAQRKWDRKNRVGKRHQVWTGIFYDLRSTDTFHFMASPSKPS